MSCTPLLVPHGAIAQPRCITDGFSATSKCKWSYCWENLGLRLVLRTCSVVHDGSDHGHSQPVRLCDIHFGPLLHIDVDHLSVSPDTSPGLPWSCPSTASLISTPCAPRMEARAPSPLCCALSPLPHVHLCELTRPFACLSVALSALVTAYLPLVTVGPQRVINQVPLPGQG